MVLTLDYGYASFAFSDLSDVLTFVYCLLKDISESKSSDEQVF